MTATLTDRIVAHSREAAALVAEGMMLLAIEVTSISDKSAAYDYAVAVDELLTGLGAPGEMLSESEPRPECNDSRALRIRIGEDTSTRVAMVLMGLTLVGQGLTGDVQLQRDYRGVLLSFIQKLKGNAPVAEPVKPTFKVKGKGESAA